MYVYLFQTHIFTIGSCEILRLGLNNSAPYSPSTALWSECQMAKNPSSLPVSTLDFDCGLSTSLPALWPGATLRLGPVDTKVPGGDEGFAFGGEEKQSEA